MGLLSSSKSTVQNLYDTTTNTNQYDNSGNSGFQNIGGGVSLTSNVDNSIYNTSNDDNSLSLSSTQNTSNSNNTSTSTSTSTTNYLTDSGAVKAASDIAGGAFGVASMSLDNAFAVNSNSLDVLKGLVSGALDNSVTLARDSIAANRAATDSAITGFGSLAQQTSASDGDRISKVAMYAFAALAAVFVLPALFRGKAVSL
jgi:hypothetical protein